MIVFRRLFSFTIIVFAALGCGPGQDASWEDPPSYRYVPDGAACTVLGVWLQDDPDLSVSLAIDGCDMWEDVGICCMSAERDDAHIRIYGNPQPCPPSPDDPESVVLATAYSGQGTVVVNTMCLGRPFGLVGEPDPAQYRVMIAHEIGHVLGVWDHVPATCTEPGIPLHPSGAPVCGPAVMNPMNTPSLRGLTGPDILQYDRRSSYDSVIPVPPASSVMPTGASSCDLLGPPPEE